MDEVNLSCVYKSVMRSAQFHQVFYFIVPWVAVDVMHISHSVAVAYVFKSTSDHIPHPNPCGFMLRSSSGIIAFPVRTPRASHVMAIDVRALSSVMTYRLNPCTTATFALYHAITV